MLFDVNPNDLVTVIVALLLLLRWAHGPLRARMARLPLDPLEARRRE
jgi:hypothetical protein